MNTLQKLLALFITSATFFAHAHPIIVAYQTGVDPSKVAQADGQFEKAINQKIEWRRFNSGAEVMTALASGSVQIGNLGSSAFTTAASNNLPIVAFLVSTKINSAEALIARNGSGINKPSDLKGKTIATPFVSTSHYSLLGALKHWGIKSQEVKIVNLNPSEIAAAWQRKDIDAAFVWSPALSQIEKTGKRLTDAGTVGQWGNPTFEVWVASKDFAEQHPEVLKQYAHVILNSFEQYNQNPQAWDAKSPQAAKIAKLVGVQAVDIPALLAGSQYPNKQEQISNQFLNGGIANATKATAQFLLEQKRIPSIAKDYGSFVSAKYIQ